VVTLGWCALLLRLAWDAFGPRAALFAALWLALPPDYLLYWSHEGRPVYLLSMALGTLALMLALRAPAHPPRRAALDFALLGLVLGMAFWENLLTLVFFPPLAAVLLPPRRPAPPRPRRAPAAPPRAGRTPRLRARQPAALAVRPAASHGRAAGRGAHPAGRADRAPRWVRQGRLATARRRAGRAPRHA